MLALFGNLFEAAPEDIREERVACLVEACHLIQFPFCQNKRLNPMASIPHFHRDRPARRNLASTGRRRRQHLA
jgi:hypothetical protein